MKQVHGWQVQNDNCFIVLRFFVVLRMTMLIEILKPMKQVHGWQVQYDAEVICTLRGRMVEKTKTTFRIMRKLV